jgi:predicted 3-demethylubiquinone-9 3-methyltransferase (glyoxalase superfamily)
MKPKNTICLWFDKYAPEAARFYAATFPNIEVTAVHKAPCDYPGSKKGDVLTVEFNVLGIPCLGLNGGPAFRHTEAFSFQIATENQEEADATGTQSWAMAERKASVVGARTQDFVFQPINEEISVSRVESQCGTRVRSQITRLHRLRCEKPGRVN